MARQMHEDDQRVRVQMAQAPACSEYEAEARGEDPYGKSRIGKMPPSAASSSLTL